MSGEKQVNRVWSTEFLRKVNIPVSQKINLMQNSGWELILLYQALYITWMLHNNQFCSKIFYLINTKFKNYHIFLRFYPSSNLFLYNLIQIKFQPKYSMLSFLIFTKILIINQNQRQPLHNFMLFVILENKRKLLGSFRLHPN